MEDALDVDLASVSSIINVLFLLLIAFNMDTQ